MRRKERWQRRKLKAEIGALTEQADAYEDTLMILQSENTSLTKKLRVAGQKVGAALLSVSLPTGGGNYSNPGKSVVLGSN